MQANKKLDQKINEISLLYKQLKKCEIDIVKMNIICSLKKLSSEVTEMMQKQVATSNTIRKKKQIDDILRKCNEIEKTIYDQNSKNLQKINKKSYQLQSFTIRGRNQQKKQLQPPGHKDSLQRMSRMVARSIIQYELDSKQLKVSPSQIDEIANRFERNHQVMKQIQDMIIQQGEDLQKVQKNLKQTYEQVQNANNQLQDAAKIQNKTRLMKIKLGLTGILGTIGLTFLGIPGMVAGLFGGLVTMFK